MNIEEHSGFGVTDDSDYVEDKIHGEKMDLEEHSGFGKIVNNKRRLIS